MSDCRTIFALLEAFQLGYEQRDLAQVDAFLELFTQDCEVIGTGGVSPDGYEWHLGREATRELVQGDWESWGDLRLDLAGASVRERDGVAWVAVAGTVSQTIGPEGYTNYLARIREYLESAPDAPETMIRYLLRGASDTLYELGRGERFVWPLRLTAVCVRDGDGWRFAQMCFSFPNNRFPDVRVL